ncbi:ribonuclease H-like domain-containing protein [Tanacetum coccineum]
MESALNAGHFARECRSKEEKLGGGMEEYWETDVNRTERKKESKALYESDSDDEYVSVQTKGLDTPSFANKQVKTPRENVKNQSTHSQKPKVNNKELGNGFTERTCFVCGSFSHLIRDCDYHVKLAKQVELNKHNMSKGNGTRERKQSWNNVQRVNKQNQFVPLAVQTKTGNIPVNTAKASGTNNFSTARQNVNRQTVLTSTALKVNTVKPIVNGVRPANVFHKTHSPSTRPLKGTTDNPHRSLQNKGIIDSGCSRHMTGNKAYLADFQDFNGGPVAFGGSKGYITGKGKIKTGKLDFEDVSFVKELQPFNLFSVSQMCDKKNKVLFTDSECLVLSPDFKLPDENQILLKVPRQNNMYSFNLENIVPLGGLACLIAKATTDESNLWHRRLGHVNFKNLNRLVKGNLVRGLPTKLFQNDHTCVACQKGKQHKASCKAKFSWTFFLRTKDETSAILKDFIRQIENQLNQKGSRGNTAMPELHNKMELLRERIGPLLRLQGPCFRFTFNLTLFGLKQLVLLVMSKQGKGPSWLFDLDYLTDSMNYHSVRSENQANLHAGQQETNQNTGTKDKIDAGDSEKEDESAQDCFELPIWHSYSSTNPFASKSDKKIGLTKRGKQFF